MIERKETKKTITWILLLIIQISVTVRSGGAEGLNIGFPEFSRDMNLVTAEDPAARFVREAVTASLTKLHAPRSKSDPPYRLDLGSSLSSNSDFTAWVVGLKENVYFSNGRRVQIEDLIFSLKRCSLPLMKKVRLKKMARHGLDDEIRLEILLYPGEDAESARRNFPLQLARCPVYEKYSSEIFGQEFGRVTSIVSAGKYNLVRFYNEKQIMLERIFSTGNRGASEYDVVLRGFRDPEHGLTALRMGTIDALFTEANEVINKALNDETLQVSSCLGSRVVKRRGFFLSCLPELEVTGMRYTE